jgi:hypothetical protein
VDHHRWRVAIRVARPGFGAADVNLWLGLVVIAYVVLAFASLWAVDQIWRR